MPRLRSAAVDRRAALLEPVVTGFVKVAGCECFTASQLTEAVT